jgi:hypothetical protein
MFTPTVIELQSALEAVCPDPFLEDRNEPPESRPLLEADLLRIIARARVRGVDA